MQFENRNFHFQYRVEARALSGLLPFNRLIHYDELDSALKDIM